MLDFSTLTTHALKKRGIIYEVSCTFPAEDDLPEETLRWSAELTIYTANAAAVEGSICARGNVFDFICGRMSTDSYYLCIPDWNVGISIAPLNDVFYNRAALEQKGLLQHAEASTIAHGLNKLWHLLS